MTNLAEKYPELANLKWKFTARSTPVHSDLRPQFRIAMIILILRLSSNKETSSLSRLHIIDWALKSDRAKDEIILFLNKERRSRHEPIRYDPALLRAVQFAIAEGILKFQSERVTLSPLGKQIADELIANKEMFNHAKDFLLKIGKKFSEPKTKKFIEYRGQEWLFD